MSLGAQPPTFARAQGNAPNQDMFPGYPQDMFMVMDDAVAKQETYGLRPGWSGSTMGMMGSVYGRGNTATMMGSGSAGMMGSGNSTSAANGDGWSSGDTTMLVMMGLLLAPVAGALVAGRPLPRPAKTPPKPLHPRFARRAPDAPERHVDPRERGPPQNPPQGRAGVRMCRGGPCQQLVSDESEHGRDGYLDNPGVPPAAPDRGHDPVLEQVTAQGLAR